MTCSLLEILDNPRQDVPLIAVLRSPLAGFSPDRLALIRGMHPAGDFYGALAACEDEDCAGFLRSLEELRSLARDMSVHRLIWRIYNQLNVLGVFGAMAGEHGGGKTSSLCMSTPGILRVRVTRDCLPSFPTSAVFWKAGSSLRWRPVHRAAGCRS